MARTQEAGSSLHEIIDSAGQVGEMVAHIATAATEQSAATAEVSSNLSEIAKITGESAEGAMQSAKACRDLSALAQDLMGKFHLSSDGKNGAAKVWREGDSDRASGAAERHSTSETVRFGEESARAGRVAGDVLAH